MIDESKSLPVKANNSTIELHLPVEAKEKIAMIDESKPLTVEANNSTIELHLPVEAKEKFSEYIESKSLPVDVKENFAIVNSKYGSLVEGNHSFPNSSFETNSESISPVKSIHSTLQSNSFSTFESKENFSSTTLNFRLLKNVEHSSKCFGPTERRFAGYEEQLDCDIYSINYEKRLQGLINANDTLNPSLSLCSALMNTFTTYKQAIVIFRNITLTILTESNGSFYTFDPHARNHDGMPNSNGTATEAKHCFAKVFAQDTDTKSNFYLNIFHQQMVKLFEATGKNLHGGLSKEDFGDILAAIDDLKVTYNCVDGKLLHVN